MIKNGEEAKKVLTKMYSNATSLTQESMIADCFYSLNEKDSIHLCKEKIKAKFYCKDLKENRAICEQIWESLFSEGK